ncbi:hypothetical protein EYF80_066444 [Liparis tanakae]|uniref:Uncharacterized protein n=1 Tax=Liparis tanakae TaxID=230148 RepID=A0A4Z2E3T2_9TELE|nr:hypothetical protein EYF80_066444 [Liparis tanakae]
MIHPSAAQRGG